MTTTISHIRSLGAYVSLATDGGLDIQAKYQLPTERWEHVVRLAKQRKPEIIRALKGPAPHRHRKPRRITPAMRTAWRAGRAWIWAHLPELEAKGWTRKKLLRADRYSYPHGRWGPAWSRNWLRERVKVSIDPDGAIRWTWTEDNGRTVSQAARPPKGEP